MFLFYGDDEDENAAALEALKTASNKLKGKILLVYSDINGEESQRLTLFLGVASGPFLRIVVPG
jgi:ribosomal protein L16/L10AE